MVANIFKPLCCTFALQVSYHQFPRDEPLKKKWIVAIKRDEGPHFMISSSTKVCSKHFKIKDYIPGVASGYKILRDTAVPSVFAFSQTKTTRMSPKKRTPLPPKKAKDQATLTSLPETSEIELLPPSPTASHAPSEVGDPQGQVEKQAEEIHRLKAQCSNLKEELAEAKDRAHKLEGEKCALEHLLEEAKSETAAFCLDRFKDSPDDLKFYTGLPDYDHFSALIGFLIPEDDTNTSEPQSSQGRKRKLDQENELFLVLVRLRLGLFEQDLACRFSISQATVSRICSKWLNLMYARLATLPLWASRDVVDATMPAAFAKKYPATRVILDATEIRCAVPSSLALQSSTYSSYKSCNTFKGLVGIMPHGLVSFVSELFTGSISDRQCVIQSGFLDLQFDEGDFVMADKGFRIADLLEKKGVGLNLPPFLHNRTFSEQEVRETQDIASVRIHVERRIQRIKSFHIFDRPIPLTLAPLINQIWTVVAILTNFQSDLIAQPESANAAS